MMLTILPFVPQGYSDESVLVKKIHATHECEDRSSVFRTHCLEFHANYDDPLFAPKQKSATYHHVCLAIQQHLRVVLLTSLNRLREPLALAEL